MKQLLIHITGLCVLAGCALSPEDQTAEDTARQWAEAYFNFDYQRAAGLTAAEGIRWLRFAASNTSQAELDLMAHQAASVDVEDVDTHSDREYDTLRTVTLRVRPYVRPALLGTEPALAEEGRFTLTVVRRDGRWLVRTEGLPRSERQSRD